jgi:hypothetical protein
MSINEDSMHVHVYMHIQKLMYSIPPALKLMRHISIINIPIRIPTQLHPKLSKTALTTPSLQSKRPRHIRPVQ